MSVPGQTRSCSWNRRFGRHPLHASLRDRGPGTPFVLAYWELLKTMTISDYFLWCSPVLWGLLVLAGKGKREILSMIGTLWIPMDFAVVVPFFVAWGHKTRFTTRHSQERRCEWRWNEKRGQQKSLKPLGCSVFSARPMAIRKASGWQRWWSLRLLHLMLPFCCDNVFDKHIWNTSILNMFDRQHVRACLLMCTVLVW